MDPVHRALAAFLSAHGVGRAESVLVAVSGGADSVALLHALVGLGQSVGVAHVHHGLRGSEADADRDFVRATAARLGVGCASASVDAREPDGQSPEARARTLRYAELERLRADGGHAWLATAHTLDDQAETLLLRALRGTGPSGLASIWPVWTQRRLLRPLLDTRREALRAYLRTRGLAWREDTSNADLRVPRNRLRHDVLPVLEEIHPGAIRKLAELAAHARRERAAGDADIDEVLARAVVAGDGGRWLDPAPLDTLAAGPRRRALARLLVDAGLAERVSAVHLRRVEAFLDGKPGGRSLSLPGAHTLVRERDRFWLGAEPGPRLPAPVRAAPLPIEFRARGPRLSWRPAGDVPASQDALRLPAHVAPSALRRRRGSVAGGRQGGVREPGGRLGPARRVAFKRLWELLGFRT